MAPELLIAIITLVALIVFVPLSSRLIGAVGAEISRDVDNGWGGIALVRRMNGRKMSVNTTTEWAERESEIRNLLKTRRRRSS
jgi:hypothetical protein